MIYSFLNYETVSFTEVIEDFPNNQRLDQRLRKTNQAKDHQEKTKSAKDQGK